MTPSVTLDTRQRQALLDRYRKDHDPEVRFRAHILLLLADGHTWATVTTSEVWAESRSGWPKGPIGTDRSSPD